VLRSLQASRVVFTPHLRERERFYSFEGSGTVSPITGSASNSVGITTQVYTHVLNRGPSGVESTVDLMIDL